MTARQRGVDTASCAAITSDCSFRKKEGGEEGVGGSGEGKEKEVERETHHASHDKIGLEFQRRGKEGGTEGQRETLYLFM